MLLESLRPDLAQGSKSTGMEVEGESASESLESTSNPAVDAGCFDVEIIDVTGEDEMHARIASVSVCCITMVDCKI